MPKKIVPENGATVLNRRSAQPERFVEDLSRKPRENHTQKKFVPAAMYFSLIMRSRWKPPTAKAASRSAGGRTRQRSPSTLQLNSSNVKRKPAARGRARAR